MSIIIKISYCNEFHGLWYFRGLGCCIWSYLNIASKVLGSKASVFWLLVHSQLFSGAAHECPGTDSSRVTSFRSVTGKWRLEPGAGTPNGWWSPSWEYDSVWTWTASGLYCNCCV